MKKKYLFGVNNFSGVHVEGLKNSIYDVKEVFNHIDVLEEEQKEEDNIIAKNFNTVVDINKRVFDYSDNVIKNGYIPLLVGGDHSIAIGSISASSNNYENIGVLWIDAHSDINTEASTVSKNIHGMPISYLLGYGNDDLAKIGDFKPKIRAENIIYFGLRDVEPQEKELIKNLHIKAYYFDEIKENGFEASFEKALKDISHCNNLHIQLDLDSMSPEQYPAVSVPVKDGFTRNEIMHILNKIRKNENIVAIDIVEYNKTRDLNGDSLKFLIEMINK